MTVLDTYHGHPRPDSILRCFTFWVGGCTINALSRLNFKPEIDLFASRLNKQFDKYCSLWPDPNAFAIDAFTFPWTTEKFYCFPPFSCILLVLQKIKQDTATGILVVPKWPYTSFVPNPFENVMYCTSLSSTLQKTPMSTSSTSSRTPSFAQTEANGMSSIRQFYSNQGLSSSSVYIIMSSWRSSTYSQYNIYIRRWQTF